MKDNIDKKVLDFYKIMPFNIYGDVRIAVLNYKTNMLFKLKKLIKKVC